MIQEIARRRFIKWLALLPCTVLFTACGGGGQSDSAVRAAYADSRLSVACSGENCAARDLHTYSGQGVGVWHFKNESDSETSLPIAINGINDASLVNLVFTNEGTAMQNLAMGTQAVTPVSMLASVAPPGLHAAIDVRTPAYLTPDKFAQSQGTESIQPSNCLSAESAWYMLGYGTSSESGNPVVNAYIPHCATLVKTVVAHDGRPVKFWVETKEIGNEKISRSFIDAIAKRFAQDTVNAYDIVTDVAGKPWGQHNESELIAGDRPGAMQALNIVFMNMSSDGSGYRGVLGLFSALNNLDQVPVEGRQISGRGLSVYLNSEKLYNDEDNWINNNPADLNIVRMAEAAKSTLAHELTHVVNFYTRFVLRGKEFYYEPWLEEMSAMLMQHIVDTNLAPATNAQTGKQYGFDTVGTGWFASWLNGNGNCSLNFYHVGTECNSYGVGGSFGVYLLHRYGVGFLRNLQNSQVPASDSMALLDSAIKNSGGLGLADDLWHNGVTLALLSSTGAPSGFGMPAWTDRKYRLPAIDNASLRLFPTWSTQSSDTPSAIRPYGFVSVVRPTQGNIYKDTISVPPRSSVTVLIQEKPASLR